MSGRKSGRQRELGEGRTSRKGVVKRPARRPKKTDTTEWPGGGRFQPGFLNITGATTGYCTSDGWDGRRVCVATVVQMRPCLKLEEQATGYSGAAEFQIFMVLSSLAEMICLPSGENDTQRTSSV